jgi:ATP-dependent RNA helicase DDX52/ROK1
MVQREAIKLGGLLFTFCSLLTYYSVEWIVFDEADSLFNTQFIEQVDDILAACTQTQKKINLFSATMLPAVVDIAKTVQKDPIHVTIGVTYGYLIRNVLMK